MIPSDWESEADIGPCPTYRHMDDVSTPHHSFCDTLLFCYVDTNLFYYCSIMTKKVCKYYTMYKKMTFLNIYIKCMSVDFRYAFSDF